MVVVANSYMLNIFRQITLFKMNLGLSLIDIKTERFDIKDGFMLKYLNMTGKQILTYGSIGKLNFYQDFTLPNREFYIFNDQSIYTIIYSDDDAKMTPENYLASIIQEISEKENIKINTTEEVKSDKIDIKLPKDQYIQEMIKKRQVGNG